jgi:methylase of polypeptide subunit release factors
MLHCRMAHKALQAAFATMHAALRESMNEDDIERLFQEVYVALGYMQVGQDILGKRGSKSGIPDVRLLNSDESVQVVVELKKPTEDLAEHEDQLFRYVRDLRARYGLLSNGKDVWLYKRTGLALEPITKTTSAELAENADILERFAKETLEFTQFAQVKVRLQEAKGEGLALTDVESLPAEQFLRAFALEPESPFGALVTSTQRLQGELLDRSEFVKGAYEFWQKTYARELSSDDVPKVWRDFLPSTRKEAIYRFTYALETAYLLSARLILAKAIQDHDKDGRISHRHIADRFLSDLDSEADDRSGRLPLTAYLKVTQTLFNRYATSLFTSIYAQDLFDWWRDYAGASETAQNAFALAVARTVLSLLRFDFARLEGDLLGELYQRYFDPETRKALGEFYTPPEVVEFILDEVGYTGDRSTRLLDPATGSGTFLITALKRYLQANAQHDPVETLEGITREFRLVAFDVNPFAVMMAQINAAALLVPLYAKAIQKNPHLVLRRLPVVRTDSLRQEVVEGEQRREGQQFGLDFGSDEITAYVELPIKDPERKGYPLRVGLTFPSLEAAKRQGKIPNERLWLLALQSVFAAVERLSQAYDEGRDLPDLEALLKSELALFEPNPDALSTYLAPYAKGVWDTLKMLKNEHGDGRFLKTLEDLMLGLVLKHYLKYDFVVGNPPYVRVQNLPDIQKQYWIDKYVWARGNFDIFIPFIERVLYGDRPWLKDEGKLGFIVPNRFLNTNYAKHLRESLPKVAKIVSITDFKAVTFAPAQEDQASRLFKEAMVYPAILIAEKGSPKGQTYTFKAARFYPKTAPLHPAEAITAVKRAPVGATGRSPLRTTDGTEYADVFTQSSEVLNPGGWYLMPDDEREVFDKLEAIGERIDTSIAAKLPEEQKRRLKNYTATESGGFAGIQTSLDSLMVLRQLDEKASMPEGSTG